MLKVSFSTRLKVALLMLFSATSVHAAKTALVSISSNGVQANSDSYNASISSDGRYIAFYSDANNLVANDSNQSDDVFVRDRQTGTTKRVSISSGGVQADLGSGEPRISGNGRHVVFYSEATNLINGDTNNSRDIFARDLQLGTTVRVSVSSNGTQANGASGFPHISRDGRYVVFISGASNLVPDDTNHASDVFVSDLQSGITTRVSVSSDQTQGNSYCPDYPAISGDGRYIAFISFATNLVVGDTNNAPDIFVHDRQTMVTTRVSVDSAVKQGNSRSFWPSISSDGRYVAFDSESNNLVSNDTNGVPDVFVHDRQTMVTTRVSVSSSGIQGNNSSYKAVMSDDGRYIFFPSYATNLGEGNAGIAEGGYVHDRQLGTTKQFPAASSVSSNGRYATFISSASDLVVGDTNGRSDVFIRDRLGDGFEIPLSVENARIRPEGNPNAPGSVAFTVTLTATTEPVTVSYRTTDGTAKAGEDYVTKSGILSFAPGETVKYVRVDFTGDSVAELNETFFLDLKTPVNATITDSRGSAYIRNDDGPSITIDNAVTIDESNMGTHPQSFVVRLSAASTQTVTVAWSTANGTAEPADYVTASGTLTFNPGVTSKLIVVLVKGDTTVEPNETYKVNLSSPTYAVLADSQGSAYIRNDDVSALNSDEDAPSE